MKHHPKEKRFYTIKRKKFLRFFNLNKEENESAGQEELNQIKKKNNTESALSKQEKILKKIIQNRDKKRKNKKKPKSNTEAELDLFLKGIRVFTCDGNCFFNQKILNIILSLVRLKKSTEITISCIERGEMSLDILMIEKNSLFQNYDEKGILIVEPVRLSVKNDGQLIIYRTIGISLVHKNKQKISKRSKKKAIFIKKSLNFFVPEPILSPKRRKEFRILICFNLKKKIARDRFKI
ncbi:LOW QUALITY PROTEIN: hypothetical protein HID58_090034 [Brassica napus]|uniref:Uncharacterized protein n=1 Tax=Brassica napus TaxID=3708 RepID=A0ABQ7XE98_BRANA|nr:LOW QUALITY PROTEIN: hypothetical protein HID58_090034 [Brassica napus]